MTSNTVERVSGQVYRIVCCLPSMGLTGTEPCAYAVSSQVDAAVMEHIYEKILAARYVVTSAICGHMAETGGGRPDDNIAPD